MTEKSRIHLFFPPWYPDLRDIAVRPMASVEEKQPDFLPLSPNANNESVSVIYVHEMQFSDRLACLQLKSSVRQINASLSRAP